MKSHLVEYFEEDDIKDEIKKYGRKIKEQKYSKYKVISLVVFCCILIIIIYLQFYKINNLEKQLNQMQYLKNITEINLSNLKKE